MKIMRRYIRYPQLDLPAAVLGAAAGRLTPLVLGHSFGTSVTGHWSMADRLLSAPAMMVSGSAGLVYRAQAHEAQVRGSGHEHIVKAGIIMLGALSFIIYMPLIIYPNLVMLVLGNSWEPAATAVAIMAPVAAMRFVAGVVSLSFYVAERLYLDLIGQALFLSALTLAAFSVKWLNGWTEVLILLSMLQAVLYGGYVLIAIRISRPREQTNA